LSKAPLPILVFLYIACSAFTSFGEALPAAEHLLDLARARLPREAVVVTGELQVRKQKGIVVRKMGVELSMDLGSDPASARCTVSDAFGRHLEQLSVTRSSRGKSRFEYSSGDPLSPAPVPDLYEPLQETDISWMDLTFSFLWWPGGTTLRAETLKGRPCYVVEIAAPAGTDGAGFSYSNVLLWIDEQLQVVLRAEGYDRDKRLVRRLWIKSLKKIDDKWMIKDMEVASFPSDHRTRFRVHDVNLSEHHDNDPDS